MYNNTTVFFYPSCCLFLFFTCPHKMMIVCFSLSCPSRSPKVLLAAPSEAGCVGRLEVRTYVTTTTRTT